ncbi:MAG: DUF4037 domain-containing protein [Lachnospiraceae bacterium]|nr:DUF4037 domain-containing protein [Lachnospiraceae bacterium]
MFFELLWNEFTLLSEVEAIALGGSRAGTHYDEKSDYDLYIYCTKVPEADIRKHILEKHCQYMEIGNSFWELEDDCTLKDGVNIDILYRNIEDFSREIYSVVEQHIAHNGYTTCMWHNLLHSRILYDKSGKLTTMQNQYNVPYPDELKDNIIQQNLRLLRGNLPAYDLQIKKAIIRKDWVSVNHRTAAFLESYFDIIFALNKLTHPGEKRMVQYAKEQAEILPVNFEENLNCLFQNLFTDSALVLQTLAAITSAVENIIEKSE